MFPLRQSFFAAACIMAAAQPSFSAEPQSASGVDLKAMDTSVNPCQNFYQYACGAWRTNNPIPPDRARWGRFDELSEHNLAIERDILEKAAVPSAGRTAVEQKIGDFYASCMDEPSIEAKGIEPVAAELERIDKISSQAELVNEVARLHRRGIRVLFNFGVSPDLKNANEQIINVDQGGLGLPDRDYYLKDDPKSVELRQKYEQNIHDMFELLAKARGETDARAAGQSQIVMNIETALAKASMDRVARRNPVNRYHIMTVDQLVSLDPEFGWRTYLESVQAAARGPQRGSTSSDLSAGGESVAREFIKTSGIPPISRLNVGAPDFVKALNKTLASANLADVKIYLTWHVLEANADLLPKAFRERNFEFFGRTLQGRKEMPPRWKHCVQSTDRALGEALGQKFVEVAFSGPSKAQALQLVGEIEKEMARDIETAAWMTPATKQQAMRKLRAVSNKIGYPAKWRDYSSVKIVRGDYFGDAVRAREFAVQRNLSRLGKPVDKTEWGMTPPTVNAYYSPPENNINFPAGILQPPFYSSKAGDAVNYGAIGVVIGHELTHGFDDQGRRFDGEGNLRDWWAPEDSRAFEARADCVAKEYGGFSPVPGVNVNGKLTLGENAADNGGIHLAYMALMDRLAGKVLPKKDGLTPQQQFFLGYAQIWCENATEQDSRRRAITDPHSPGQFRVNGVVQNLKEFSDAFQCKPGDPMVSSDPCRVW